MDGSKVAYYSVAATAIPVLILGYVAGTVALMRRWNEKDREGVGIVLLWIMVGNLSKREANKRIAQVIGITTLAAGAVIFVLIAPVVGECFALAALATGHPAGGAVLVTAVGLAAAACGVLYAPMSLIAQQWTDLRALRQRSRSVPTAKTHAASTQDGEGQ
jgi:hypothetical protein